METVLEILRKTEEFLHRKGVPEAKLDAEHILASVLSCGRMDLYLQFDRPLTEDILARIRPMLSRRAKREPLSQLIGSHPFHDLTIQVDPHVLCPRPETEELVEKAAGALASKPNRILDLGTGSGAIALWMKKRFPESVVVGADRSAAALSVARTNAAHHDLEIEWIESNWFDRIEPSFELIVSNPPYLTVKEWESSEPEVRDHEPKEALVSGVDGLDDLRRILSEAKKFLKPGGLLALETGIDHRQPLLAMAKEAGYAESWGKDDLQGRHRFLFCRV